MQHPLGLRALGMAIALAASQLLTLTAAADTCSYVGLPNKTLKDYRVLVGGDVVVDEKHVRSIMWRPQIPELRQLYPQIKEYLDAPMKLEMDYAGHPLEDMEGFKLKVTFKDGQAPLHISLRTGKAICEHAIAGKIATIDVAAALVL